MTDLQALANTLRRSLGAGIGVGASDPTLPAPPLLPEEVTATTRMVNKRYREFAAGRCAARTAMTDLGLPRAAVPMGEDRAPLWPTGCVGSISHCATAAIALVARSRDLTGLGLDIEEDIDLPPDLWPEILTSAELDWLNRQPISKQGRHAKVLFCAKEAVHKLHHPMTGRLLGFDAVTITLDGQMFRTRLPLDIPGLPEVLVGQVLHRGGLVIAVLTGSRGNNAANTAFDLP